MFLHSLLFSISFFLAPSFLLSSFTTSRNFLFGFPLFLFLGNSISITVLPTYFWPLLMTCPYHLSLPSLIFIPNRFILAVPMMYSFLILSFFCHSNSKSQHFYPCNFHLFCFVFFACFFVTSQVHRPLVSLSKSISIVHRPLVVRPLLVSPPNCALFLLL